MSSIEERFWSKVEKIPFVECWLWSGATTKDGHGQLHNGCGSRLAHRLSWEIHHGPIGVGLLVLHHCDNAACVNPGHLRLGTQLDNMADRESRNRRKRPHGVLNGMSKLTDYDIAEIRIRCNGPRGTRAALAREFGVSDTMISFIALGRNWSHVK